MENAWRVKEVMIGCWRGDHALEQSLLRQHRNMVSSHAAGNESCVQKQILRCQKPSKHYLEG
jgi:hypothetical protein